MLDEVLQSHGGRVEQVFLLDVPREILVDRLSGRRICKNCGAVYHVRNIPPRVAACATCAGARCTSGADDTEETVLNRLEVFKKQTESLIDYYEKRKVLFRIDAGRKKENTQAEIVSMLKVPARSS